MGSWLALEPNLLVMVWCTLVLLPGVKLGVVAESIEPCRNSQAVDQFSQPPLFNFVIWHTTMSIS